jgi:hypothetical protein
VVPKQRQAKPWLRFKLDLETAWDDDQATLQTMDGATWTAIYGRIDTVLTGATRRQSRPHDREAGAQRTADRASVRHSQQRWRHPRMAPNVIVCDQNP